MGFKDLAKKAGKYTVSSGSNVAPDKKFYTQGGAVSEAHKRAQNNPVAAHDIRTKSKGVVGSYGSGYGMFNDVNNTAKAPSARLSSFNAEIPGNSPFGGTQY